MPGSGESVPANMVAEEWELAARRLQVRERKLGQVSLKRKTRSAMT